MKIHRVTISKEKLMSVPENERAFFVLSSNALNDINFLHKQVLYAKKIIDNEILQKAQNSFSFFNLKILAGKLLETWNMVRNGFLSSPDHKDYRAELDDKGKECIWKVK